MREKCNDPKRFGWKIFEKNVLVCFQGILCYVKWTGFSRAFQVFNKLLDSGCLDSCIFLGNFCWCQNNRIF